MKKPENNNAQRDFFKEVKLKHSPFHQRLLKMVAKIRQNFKLICFKNNIKSKTEPFQVLFFFFFG
ncbi:hypothetical protein ACR9LD_07385 [Helicobacter pylori]